MQNNVVITDSNKFEETINALENSFRHIQNIIESERKNVELINETETWSGICAKSMYNKYKELNDNYYLIEYSLDLYNKFLKKTLEDYTLLETEISKNIDNMASSLDVNS